MSIGNDIIAKNMAERAYKKSVQERMDEEMCRPGYRWHGEPLNKCLPGAYIGSSNPDPGTPEPQPHLSQHRKHLQQMKLSLLKWPNVNNPKVKSMETIEVGGKTYTKDAAGRWKGPDGKSLCVAWSER